ncbi:MAG: PHP domain-containing protein [Bryobacterales bacterium]|nr:PHP domain-containing protein [Bryobacterales bacterium]MBV9400904.1 PHP domain-containing protein [Bryobacterales bacterium]
MIDLHSHTDRSDGTLSPAALVERAVQTGLTALAITDHDTFAGYELALPVAQARRLDLVCGIELSTRPEGPGGGQRPVSIHLLGYFPAEPPSMEFRQWIQSMLKSRHQRNLGLIDKLRSFGLDISLEEVQALGKHLTARPHFAQVLLRKGYVSSLQEAFDVYLADEAKAAVARDEPPLKEAIRKIGDAGGIASLAHPVRIPGGRDRAVFAPFLKDLAAAGLHAIEVIHTEHQPSDIALYQQMANEFGLLATGGSDFHGDTKPGIELGTGRNNNVHVDAALLDRMRARCAAGQEAL